MKEYTFSLKDIEAACQSVVKMLSDFKVEHREAVGIKLALEDVLLEYREKFGESVVYKLKYKKGFSSLRIEFNFMGECFNPLEKEEGSVLISGLLSKMGIAPSWNYKNGRNNIVFIAKKKPVSQIKKMLVAVALSVVAGVLLTVLPDGFAGAVSKYFLTPMTNLFMGLISAIAGPLVFLSVLGSICSMGDLETFGKIGKRTISAILVYAGGIGLFVTIIAALFFDISPGGSAGSDFSKILELIYNIVPSNLFEPFLTGNALQIIFIAIIFGMAMLMLSSKVAAVSSIVEQLSTLLQMVMGIITEFLPYVVFIIFTNIIAGGGLKDLISSWKMMLIMFLLILVVLVGIILWICIRKRVSPVTIVKKILPTYIIALTTASSAAAFSTNIKDANEKLGINKKTVEFGTPLGQAMFKPCVVVFLCVLQLTFAENHGMDITIAWLVLGYITNLLVSFAVPPVAGGALIGITISFAQLGIPLEMMGIAIALNTIVDFPSTATNTVGWQLVLTDVADSLGLLDKDTLRKN